MPSAGHGRIYGAVTTTIDLNEVEIASLSKFVEEHQKCKSAGGWPRRFNISSTPNGIACTIKVTCQVCETSENISDMDCW